MEDKRKGDDEIRRPAYLVRFSQPTVCHSGMAVPRSPTQTDQSARAYPLKWIEDVFNSKEKTEHLLRPEVENGNVTYHDMELAQSFFSSRKRSLPLIYSSLAFLGTVAYSQVFARPRWKLPKLVTIGTFMGFSSYTFGFNQKLSAHFKFARSLENPKGFNQALRNVNTRLGGPEQFPFGVPERREELMSVTLGPGVTSLSKDTNVNASAHETTEPNEGWNASPSQDGLDQNQAQQTRQGAVQRSPSKWDEIRTANNKTGAPTSWDLIRQSHERNKMPPPPSAQSSTSRSSAGGTIREGTYEPYGSPDLDSSLGIDENKWDKRALDEAQFEAVLDAERRRAS